MTNPATPSEHTGAGTPGQAEPAPEQPYAVRVAPAVLAIIVQRTAQQVPGVTRLLEPRGGARRPRGGATYSRDGVQLVVHEGRVRVAVHLAVGRSHPLQSVGSAVQEAVAQALETLVGMPVEAIDIYVQDVD